MTSLYVAGAPGAGKTLTVIKAVDQLAKDIDFEKISINLKMLPKPQKFYQIIYEKVTGGYACNENA